MSQRCATCGRGAKSGQRRSHSNTKTKRLFRVNLQRRRVDGANIRVCTRCIRTSAKHAAAAALPAHGGAVPKHCR